ncbi:MAG TPA: type II secretion system F family protein [Ilumatobacter sp.]|nr:type II secretion system F family protein [Ilumatobacter sp.]
MPKFAYSAIDANGVEIGGTTKADTIGTARTLLVEQNLFPIKIEESRGLLDLELTKEKVKKKNLMNFTRQLSVFIKAGIPITNALTTIGDESTDVALRRAIGTMVEDLRNGGLLSVAAAQHPQVFPDYYIGILQSAELTGRLDESLDSLAGYINREMETRSKVVGALAYPLVVMGLAMVTVVILAGYVLPQFKPLFEELGADLPVATRLMLFVARFFTDLWYVTAVATLMFVGAIFFLTVNPTGKELWQRWSLKIPAIGGIIEYAILERFCSVLYTMLHAGVSVPSAMETTTEAVSNVVYREQLDIARQQMLEGSGFTQPLIDTELFPGAARQMFRVGEETGTLDEQLEVAAEYFNRELEYRIKTFTTLFEPIMIIFVGVVVGFVAIALVSAMYGVLGGVKEVAG